MKRIRLFYFLLIFAAPKAYPDTVVGCDDSGPFYANVKETSTTLHHFENNDNLSVGFGMSPAAIRVAWYSSGKTNAWKIATYNSTAQSFDVHTNDTLPSPQVLWARNDTSPLKLETGLNCESAISDDAARIAVRIGACLYILDSERGTVLGQHIVQGLITGPRWSHDGQFLSYFYSDRINAERTGGYVLRIYDVKRGEYRDISQPSGPTAVSYFPRSAVWNGSSSLIFFISNFSNRPGFRGAYLAGPEVVFRPEPLMIKGNALGLDIHEEELYVFTSRAQYAGKMQGHTADIKLIPTEHEVSGTGMRLSPGKNFLLFRQWDELWIRTKLGAPRLVSKLSMGESNWVRESTKNEPKTSGIYP